MVKECMTCGKRDKNVENDQISHGLCSDKCAGIWERWATDPAETKTLIAYAREKHPSIFPPV